jgi:NTP pyrophosphatase (non-canonical NTP hydrolase)
MELNSELDRLIFEFRRLKKFDEIQQELERAEDKHLDFPSDMFRQVAIINKEAGEVTKAVLDYYYGNGPLEDIKKELRQTAAVCMRMLEEVYPMPRIYPE